MKYKALLVSETAEGKFQRSIVEKDTKELGIGEVLIRVRFSALNYKDALSATGNKGITRKYPHTPGIDAAGIVEESSDKNIKVGQEVLLTGYDLGMNTSGGFAQYIRVPSNWILTRPAAYSLKDCMVIGTAGFTAASALHKMELMGMKPGKGPIVVTGSTGGVGSLAIAILSTAGYEVWAITGKLHLADYLKKLGATKIENRDFVDDRSGKNLLRPKWAGAIDTVGGNILATLLKACMLDGTVVSTGLVGSSNIETTVYPFILNGVSLLGVGSAETPLQTRSLIWKKLENSWNIKNKLDTIAKEVTLEELNDIYIDAILHGKIQGRIVVKL